MLSPVLVTPPVDLPVTLAEAKMHLRIDPNDATEDDMILRMIRAATERLDGYDGLLGRAICPQTWAQEYDGFCRELTLPFGPVVSVSSVNSGDVTDYRLLSDGRGPFVRFGDVSVSGPVTVEFVAGYVSVPDPIVRAILLDVGDQYRFREDMVENVKPSGTYNALVSQYSQIR